jgi:hypothetical protein
MNLFIHLLHGLNDKFHFYLNPIILLMKIFIKDIYNLIT